MRRGAASKAQLVANSPDSLQLSRRQSAVIRPAAIVVGHVVVVGIDLPKVVFMRVEDAASVREGKAAENSATWKLGS